MGRGVCMNDMHMCAPTQTVSCLTQGHVFRLNDLGGLVTKWSPFVSDGQMSARLPFIDMFPLIEYNYIAAHYLCPCVWLNLPQTIAIWLLLMICICIVFLALTTMLSKVQNYLLSLLINSWLSQGAQFI